MLLEIDIINIKSIGTENIITILELFGRKNCSYKRCYCMLDSAFYLEGLTALVGCLTF